MARTWTYSRALLFTCGLALLVVTVLVWKLGEDWPMWALLLFVGFTLSGLGICIVSVLGRGETLEQWARGSRGVGGSTAYFVSLVLMGAAAPIYWLGKQLVRLWHREDRA